MKEDLGFVLSGANAPSCSAYQEALRQLRCYVDDPIAKLDEAIAASPDMIMAHIGKAWLNLLGTEPAGTAVALACCDAAARLPASERERMHLEAVRRLASGRWRGAGRLLEDLTIHHPRDLLALQVGHQIDYYTGDARMLRDRIARALPSWDRSMPGFHCLLGMHAFGLEECGEYAVAEQAGHAAVELEQRDGWAWHAVAHVHEMRHEPSDGIAWLAPNANAWARGSFFAVHNWWHLALFHLERGELGEVLRLYDEVIAGAGSTVILDLIDASAMLWRLQLQRIDLGDRWDVLARRWASVAAPGRYAFNDLHMTMAYVGAGLGDRQAEVLEAQRRAVHGEDDNAMFTREVGHAAAQAVVAFGEQRYADSVRLLRDVRSQAHRFGGSHAQRDVLDLTLLEAARRTGDEALARALEDERRLRRGPIAPAPLKVRQPAPRAPVPGAAASVAPTQVASAP